jgi:glycosyltransferase involved in cell wall biosynthesis
VPVKDQATLIDAVARVARSNPDVRLLLAGDGPLRYSLEARAAVQGVGDRVTLLGHRSDVETVLNALDVFALSSTSEGLSNTILEAMASGLPVVATRVGGADELVDDGVSGLLVPPSDPIALAAALGELTGNRDKRLGMGAAARRRAESEFALSRMIGRYEDMYWRLAKSGDPDGGC